MSQQFNDDFNNNQNTSDMQNTNNFEDELQQPQPDNAVGSDSVSELENSEDKNGIETLLKDHASHCLNINIDMPEQDLVAVPSETCPSDVSNAENGTNISQSDNELQSFLNSEQTPKIYHSKTTALNDFAFCQIGNKKVPVYPYVVALTGHRDAITEPVKEIAKNQLRSLAKAWDKACNAKKWKKTYANKNCKWKCTERVCEKTQKSAPLIALVGLDDGESGKLWIKIASELRDKEKFNIKVVAVASIPFVTMLELKKKRYEITGNHSEDSALPPNFIDDIKKTINQIDGLIELPPDNDVRYLLHCLETFESFCTDDQPHTYELIKMLMSNEHFLELQFDEYRKFMCVHSHTLIALTNNVKKWQNEWEKKNNCLDSFIASPDVQTDVQTNVQTNLETYVEADVERNKSESFQTDFKEFKNKIEFAVNLEKLVNKIYNLKQSQKDITPVQYLDLKKSFEIIAQQYKGQQNNISRTESMISYKLFGNIKSRLNPFGNEEIHEITFTSIGPVVCIQTNRSKSHKTPNEDSKKDKPEKRIDKPGSVAIIVKDQPDDYEYELAKVYSWNPLLGFSWRKIKFFWLLWFSRYSRIKYYPEIMETINKLGRINDACIDNASLNSDKGCDSLEKHMKYADLLAKLYYSRMKKVTRFSAGIALVVLFSLYCGVFSYFAGNTRTTIITEILFLVSFACLLISQSISLWKRYDKDYHHFRALADALGIQHFWKLADINIDVAGEYKLHQISDIGWLRSALNGLSITLLSTPDSNSQQENENENGKNDNEKQFGIQQQDIEDCKKTLEQFKSIKADWIDEKLKELTGKNASRYERFKNFAEKFLDSLSFLDGKGSTFVSIFILVFFIIGNLLSQCKTSNRISPFLNNYVYQPFYNLLSWLTDKIFVVCNNLIILLILVTIIIEVYNLYRKYSLKNLDIKRRRQLLYPFRRASLLINIKLAHCIDSIENIDLQLNHKNLLPSTEVLPALQNDNSDNSNNINNNCIVINKFQDEIRNILKDLGIIELTISAEWFLGADKRKFEIAEKIRLERKNLTKNKNFFNKFMNEL